MVKKIIIGIVIIFVIIDVGGWILDKLTDLWDTRGARKIQRRLEKKRIQEEREKREKSANFVLPGNTWCWLEENLEIAFEFVEKVKTDHYEDPFRLRVDTTNTGIDHAPYRYYGYEILILGCDDWVLDMYGYEKYKKYFKYEDCHLTMKTGDYLECDADAAYRVLGEYLFDYSKRHPDRQFKFNGYVGTIEFRKL